MFEAAQNMLRLYLQANEPQSSQNHRNLANEADERLSQMQWLLAQIRSREGASTIRMIQDAAAFRQHVTDHLANGGTSDTVPAVPESPGREKAARQFIEDIFETQLLTEAFYYFAARLRSVIRKLPGLQSFEAEGTRNVRNKLIEHPDKDKDSGVLSRSFAMGGETGPIVKAIRDEAQQDIFPDAGLYTNVQELRENLERCLSKAQWS